MHESIAKYMMGVEQTPLLLHSLSIYSITYHLNVNYYVAIKYSLSLSVLHPGFSTRNLTGTLVYSRMR